MIRFDGVTYTYPFQTAPAVSDITFSVAPGELVLCTGVSGCGKSTLMRLANGLCPQYYQGEMRGSVLVNGADTISRPLYAISEDIGTLFQNPEEQFFALNVEDEIVFTHEWRNRTRDEIRRRLEQVRDDFNLEPVLASSVHELSEGQKQKVGLASILSLEPRALILDEPTANLDPEATEDLARHLLRLKQTGMAILVVDHRLYWLAEVADRVLVMDKGRLAAEGAFSILHDDSLRNRYGLRKAGVSDPRTTLEGVEDLSEGRHEGSYPRIDVRNLHFAYKDKTPIFSGASFSLPAGITALVGDNGAGKTTLARLLTGLNKSSGGEFMLDGNRLAPGTVLDHAGLVLQNADHQLYMKTVLDEVITSLRLSPRYRESATCALPAMQKKAECLLEDFALLPLAPRHPQSLSGGEKQRLVIACALAKQPDVLILDEPTSGLDGRNMQRIAASLDLCAKRGACVLVITHDLELMEAVCSRALRLPLNSSIERARPDNASETATNGADAA